MNDVSVRRKLTAQPQDLSFLDGGGEMARVVREKDWSKTPLGPIESWPQSLRTTVSLVLNSNFPIALAWGANRTQIYNDGYWPICAAKHPHSMGQDFRECWFSAWPVIGAAFDQATGGQTAFLENQRMFLDRRGYLEETFFTFSFSPIRDETGNIAGLFHPVTEMTQETLAKRRLKVMRDLADHVAEAASVEEAGRRIGESLATAELDLPFTLLYLLNSDGTRAKLVARTGIDAPALAPAEVSLGSEASLPWSLVRVARSGKTERVDSIRPHLEGSPCGPYPEAPDHAFVLPIALPGVPHPLAICVAGVSSRRPLDDPYATFYDMLREGITTALANARAYEEERRRAEALAELDRAKTAFFSNVSHEFRTPLTLMLGPVADTLADPHMPAAVRERLEVAHRNALRLLKLVNSLLDFSRIEAGRVQASYEPTDLAELTCDLASTFRSAIERAGLVFEVDCLQLPEAVYVDREMWEKIVLNLLSNAFKFTLKGSVAVRLRAQGRDAVLEVCDTGVGVRAADLPRLFERFYRIEGSEARTQEGSGIGLALVQELVRLHGGSISVASSFGEATTFTIRLPFGTSHLPADRVRAPRQLASTAIGAHAFVQEALRWLPDVARDPDDVHESDAATNPKERRFAATFGARVVLADDNADMRTYVHDLLSRYYAVETAPDGEAALAACRREPPELLLSDIMMPRLDGFGLLAEIRKDPRLKDLPVMLLSARAGEESRVEGLDAGADDYIVKPFSAREMIARVGAIIERERTRRESEARFRSMADSTPVMVWVGEPDGHCSFLSRRWYEFTGQTPETGLVYGWKNALHPEDVSATFTSYLNAVARREAFRMEFRLRRFDGEYVHALAAAAPRLGENGELLGFIGSVLDINERKLLEAEREMLLEAERAARSEAEAATRLKDEFLATLSHELRTPLSVIVGYGRVLLHKYAAGNEDMRKGLQLIVDNAMAQSQIITDLLDMSRIVRGKVTLDARPQPLDTLVEACVAAQRPAAEARGLEMRFESELSGSATVLADAGRLQQVLGNLLSNAIKFTAAGGRILTSTRAANAGYEIVVRDTGEGIAPDALPHIFERFRQGDGSIARRHGGLGLGLAIVKQLVELHGGNVRAASEGKGRGATFVVWLPPVSAAIGLAAGAGDAAASAFQQAVLLEPDSLQGLEVLVIEDSAAMLEYTKRLLSEHGAHVQGFTSARAALESLHVLAGNTHRLVLVSDLGMPELDGFALIRTLRSELALSPERLPAVAVTAFARDEDRQRALAAGYQAYLSKPFEAAQLIAAVRQLAKQGPRLPR